jgi:hypothetical protein
MILAKVNEVEQVMTGGRVAKLSIQEAIIPSDQQVEEDVVSYELL